MRRSWAICAAPVKSTHAGASMTLMVRRLRRPCPRLRTRRGGTSAQGRFWHAVYRVGWLFFTVNTSFPPAPRMARAVSCWVCIASTVTTTPARSKPARRVRTAGISLLLAATASCPSTVPLVWSNAATRCGAPRSRRRAPRMVLPSIAITRCSPRTVVRVHSQAPITAARASASRPANTRRNVDSSGARPGSSPVVAAGVCAAAHSPIAANERAPAMTALNPTARSCDSGYRTPRRARGSGTAPNNVSSAVSSATRSDPAAAVGEDGMSGCGPRARWLM